MFENTLSQKGDEFIIENPPKKIVGIQNKKLEKLPKKKLIRK